MFASKIARNLVSGSTLNRMGYKLVFESNRCVISKGGVFIGRCYWNCNLFKHIIIMLIVQVGKRLFLMNFSTRGNQLT